MDTERLLRLLNAHAVEEVTVAAVDVGIAAFDARRGHHDPRDGVS